MILDLILCGLILLAALAAIAGLQVFRSIVFFVVYGVLVGVAWVRLGAVDVALAEAAIGAGLTGVLLLSASARLPVGQGAASFRPWAAVLAAGLSGMLAWAWFVTPVGNGLTAEVGAQLQSSGVGNPVTAVLLNFRAWDTLLESIVLLAALLGLWMLGREGDWGRPLGLRQVAREGGTLDTLGRFLPPLGFLVGVYLVWAGADQPGGAFQGGTVLAAMGILAAMAGRFPAPRVSNRLWRLGLVVGPGVFLLAGLALHAAGWGFLTYPEAHAKSLIMLIEVFLTLSIAATLALLLIGPPGPAGARSEPQP